MKVRLLALFCALAAASTSRADIVVVDEKFNSSLNGWTSEATTSGHGLWSWDTTGLGGLGNAAAGAPLSGGRAVYSLQNAGSGIIRLYHDFQLGALVSANAATASLSWSQYLFADNPNAWQIGGASVNWFRVVLTDMDSTLTSFEAFNTSGNPPSNIGPASVTNNSAGLVSFLNNLGINKTVRIAFEVETNGSTNAEIDNVAFSFSLAAVPEPSSLVLASLAAGGLLVKRRRSRRKAAQVVAAV